MGWHNNNARDFNEELLMPRSETLTLSLSYAASNAAGIYIIITTLLRSSPECRLS